MDNNKVKVTLKIFRYNPEADRKSHYDTYELEVERTERVLDMLEYVKGYYDGTLSFRRSCAHGICGSDAMRINGRNYLACKALVKDIGTKITVLHSNAHFMRRRLQSRLERESAQGI